MYRPTTTATESNPTTRLADKAVVIEELSRQFRAPLARFFEHRIGQQAEVDDLVQEVFLRLAASDRIESVDRPEAYIFRTAANLLIDRKRRLTTHAADAHDSYDEALHGGARETCNPERALLGTQALEQLVAILHELPVRTRTIWVLYHLEDLSHAEIGRRLGITVSTIEKHMSRASARLLKKLDHLP
jgi:RNA polymerase sigma-70 factor (ECF subfamily)